jgi:hypothetical protein
VTARLEAAPFHSKTQARSFNAAPFGIVPFEANAVQSFLVAAFADFEDGEKGFPGEVDAADALHPVIPFHCLALSVFPSR